jgi:hypothetical protein
MRKYRKFTEGGDVNYGEDERPAATGMSDAAELMPEKPKSFKEAFAEAKAAGEKTFTFGGKRYTTETAGAKSSAPVAGRPRGESGPVSVTRQMADRAAADTQNARAASERRAAAAREAESERSRESRRATPPGTAPKRGAISMTGVNPKTLLPGQGFAKGGKIDGCAVKGGTKGTIR